jgi:hypothetical protein
MTWQMWRVWQIWDCKRHMSSHSLQIIRNQSSGKADWFRVQWIGCNDSMRLFRCLYRITVTVGITAINLIYGHSTRIPRPCFVALSCWTWIVYYCYCWTTFRVLQINWQLMNHRSINSHCSGAKMWIFIQEINYSVCWNVWCAIGIIWTSYWLNQNTSLIRGGM